VLGHASFLCKALGEGEQKSRDSTPPFPSKNRLFRRHSRQNDPLLFIVEKSHPLLTRVSGASHRANSRQNDKHAKKGKNGAAAGAAEKHGRGLAELSERKHLTSREVERLIEATKGRRNGIRGRCLLLLMFRHGLRVSEACGMKLDQVDTESRVLHVARLKGGLSTTQPLRSDELRAVSAWLKERARMKPIGKAFFVSEQRKPLHRSTVNLLLITYSRAASLPLFVHPYMLRHACGFALADQGADTRLIQDYLGHRNIQHTVKYTATNPARFEKLWR
jgi:type 1 fimbriae regulatory protein FimB